MRPAHHNMQVRGDKEEGTTTPLDMVVLDDIDRYHRAKDVVDRVPGSGPRGARLVRIIRDKLDAQRLSSGGRIDGGALFRRRHRRRT